MTTTNSLSGKLIYERIEEIEMDDMTDTLLPDNLEDVMGIPIDTTLFDDNDYDTDETLSAYEDPLAEEDQIVPEPEPIVQGPKNKFVRCWRCRLTPWVRRCRKCDARRCLKGGLDLLEEAITLMDCDHFARAFAELEPDQQTDFDQLMTSVVGTTYPNQFEFYQIRKVSHFLNMVKLNTTLKKRMKQGLYKPTQYPKRQWKEQMDSIASAGMAVVSNMAGAVISSGLQSLGKAVKTTFNKDHDSPAILRNDFESMAICDVPREVCTHAFKGGDFTLSETSHFSADKSKDVADLLARMKVLSRVASFSWPKSAVVGDELLTASRVEKGLTGPLCVGPNPVFRAITTTDPTRRTYVHTALSATALMYRKWRGSITYTIEVLPTMFHQGQLWVAFQPWTADGTESFPTFPQSWNCVGATIDLSLSNRTELTIPYNSMLSYLVSRDTNLHVQETILSSTGRLFVFVQNPLAGNETVSDTIDVNIWISAGNDFELAIPKDISNSVYVDGEWRQNSGHEEVIDDMKLAPPTVLPIAGLNTQTLPEFHRNCNVPGADTSTIAGREYPLSTGVTWTTSQTTGTIIASLEIASLFNQAVLSITGLLAYHNYFRGDFEIKLRMNAQPFFTGMLAMFAIPADMDIADSLITALEPTLNQWPCTFYTPAANTTVILRIPWTNVLNVVTTATLLTSPKCLGTLKIYVYNALRSGTGGTQLTGVMWGEVIEPMIAFKKANVATTTFSHHSQLPGGWTEQGGVTESTTGGDRSAPHGAESTDTQLQEATGGRVMPTAGPVRLGYIRTAHMNAYELLRRPAFMLAADFDPVTTLQSTRIATVPIGGLAQGKTHSYIESMYYAWKGGRRIVVASNANAIANILLMATTDFNANGSLTANVTAITENPEWFDGTVIWRPNLETTKTISIPYYARTDVLRTCAYATSQESDETVNGQFRLYFAPGHAFNTQGEYDVTAILFRTIADDFTLFHPMPYPPTSELFTTPVEDWKEQMGDGWVRDLTEEGISPNPGPVDDQQTTTITNVPPPQPSEHKLSDCEQELTAKDKKIIDEFVKRSTKKSGFSIKEFFLALQALLSGMYDWCARKVTGQATRQLTDKMEKAYNGLVSKVLPVVTWVLDFVGNLYTIFTTNNTTMRAIALTAITTKCLVASSFGAVLLKKLEEGGSYQWRPQGCSPETYSSLGTAIATTLVAGTIGILGYGLTTKDSKNIRDLTLWKICESAACLSKLNSGMKATPELWKMVKEATEMGAAYLVDGEDLLNQWVDKNDDRIRFFVARTDEDMSKSLFDANNIFKLQDGELNYERLERHAKFAFELKTHATGARPAPVIALKNADKILELYTAAKKSYDNKATRTEPVGIFVQGPAGSGKSYSWTKFLPYIIMKKAGLVKDYADAQTQLYVKPCDPEQKFFDGYKSQKYVLIDDFMAGTEDKDALQIINLISVAQCPLNMASIHEKTTSFDSGFVCVTTNQKSVQVVNAVRDKAAIIRRFPHAFYQKPSPEFEQLDAQGNGTKKLNMRKFKDELDQLPGTVDDLLNLCSRAWTLTRLDLQTGSMGDQLTMREVVEEIVRAYKTRTKIDTDIDLAMAKFQGIGEGWEIVRQLKSYTFDEEVKLECGPVPACSDLQETDEVLRAYYPMIAWKLQRKQKLDYTAAQRILRQIRGDVQHLGYPSYTHFCNAVNQQLPGAKESPAVYEISGSNTFEIFCRTLYSIKNETDIGPKKKKWVGLVRCLTIAAGLVAATGIVYGIVKLVGALFKRVFCYTENGYDHGGNKQPFAKAGKAGIRSSWAGKEQTGVRDVNESIRRGIRQIKQGTYHLYCLAVDPRTLIVPRHFFEKYLETKNEETVVQLEELDRTGKHLGFTPINMTRRNVEPIEVGSNLGILGGEKDLVVVKLIGSVCRGAKKIRHLIMPESDVQKLVGSEIAGMWMKPTCEVAAIVRFRDPVLFNGRVALQATINGASKDGECGFPYVMDNTLYNKPLIGLHSLGKSMTNKVGIANLTLEAFEEAEQLIMDRIPCPEPIESMELEGDWKSNIFMPKELECLGNVKVGDEALVRFIPKTTDMERTGLKHAGWSDEFVPTQKTPIRVGDKLVHPLFSNLEKFVNRKQQPPPLAFHRRAIEHIKARIGTCEDTHIFTPDECINGFENVSPLVLSTSCGYLQKYYTDGKSELFEALPQETENGELLPIRYVFSDVARTRVIPIYNRTFVDLLEYQETRIENGEEPLHFFCATNKDELTTVVKQKKGKTRVFLQSGLDLTFLMRKYFGAFINHYRKHIGFKFCHAIGSDKEAVWAAFREGLQSRGGNGFDIDFSNYDGTVPQEAVECFLEVVQNFYRDDYSLHRQAIFHSVVHSTVIASDLVFCKNVGIPSGIVMTEITNTIENWYLMLLAYQVSQDIAGQPINTNSFDEDVRMLAYGDDVIMGVKDEVLENFNRVTVKETLALLGMEVTAADKTAQIIPFEPIDDLSFLKSTFEQRAGLTFAPLPMKVIHRELIWGKRANRNDKSILEQKIDMAMQMAAHHGPAEVEKLRKELSEVGVTTHFSYELWEEGVRSKQEIVCVEGVGPIHDAGDFYFLEREEDLEESEGWVMQMGKFHYQNGHLALVVLERWALNLQDTKPNIYWNYVTDMREISNRCARRYNRSHNKIVQECNGSDTILFRQLSGEISPHQTRMYKLHFTTQTAHYLETDNGMLELGLLVVATNTSYIALHYEDEPWGVIRNVRKRRMRAHFWDTFDWSDSCVMRTIAEEPVKEFELMLVLLGPDGYVRLSLHGEEADEFLEACKPLNNENPLDAITDTVMYALRQAKPPLET